MMSYGYSSSRGGAEIGASPVGYIVNNRLTTITSAADMSPNHSRRDLGPIFIPSYTSSTHGHEQPESLSEGLRPEGLVSSPGVISQETTQADHGSLGLPNERRRNRLGYHRSPIACGKSSLHYMTTGHEGFA